MGKKGIEQIQSEFAWEGMDKRPGLSLLSPPSLSFLGLGKFRVNLLGVRGLASRTFPSFPSFPSFPRHPVLER